MIVLASGKGSDIIDGGVALDLLVALRDYSWTYIHDVCNTCWPAGQWTGTAPSTDVNCGKNRIMNSLAAV